MKTIKKSLVLSFLTLILAGVSLNSYAWKFWGKEITGVNDQVRSDHCLWRTTCWDQYIFGIKINSDCGEEQVECSEHDPEAHE